jgi:ADP-ribose pyrophosphatase YjhB (NUDIX family)
MPSDYRTFFNNIKRLQALAENGQHYAHSDYDLDRYSEILNIANEMMSEVTKLPTETISLQIAEKNGYRTAKVDVRAVVFNQQNEILMVREKVDGNWSLPGGWADVGYSPAEVAEKETMEEAGMKVRARKLLGVFDKKFHDHPADIYYVYKIFILCEAENSTIDPGYETLDAAFFPDNNLPELSRPRNTEKQISIMFASRKNPDFWPYIDLT